LLPKVASGEALLSDIRELGLGHVARANDKNEVEHAERLSHALKLWIFNHFFAQSTNGKGGIYEFQYNEDGTISDYNIFAPRELAQKYGSVASMLAGKEGGWLHKEEHRYIRGVGFFPRPEYERETPGYVNTFSGLPIAPVELSSLPYPEQTRVRGLLDRIHWHWREIIAGGDNHAYEFQKKWFSWTVQGRGKKRIFHQFYSEHYQCGKGAFVIDLVGKILGST
jgi:hypothetical protein